MSVLQLAQGEQILLHKAGLFEVPTPCVVVDERPKATQLLELTEEAEGTEPQWYPRAVISYNEQHAAHQVAPWFVEKQLAAAHVPF